MRRTLHPPAPPTQRDVHRGRPYWLWLPTRREPPWPAMVIVHGAGSRKENHADFARACAAAGWVALAYDQRGHGDSADEMSPRVVADAGAMAAFLADRPDVDADRVCIRGSSLGGFVALHALSATRSLAGAIAICPAQEDHLLRGLRNETLEMRVDPRGREKLEAWLGEHDLRDAVALAGTKPTLFIHASGDERIPSESSKELCSYARDPRKLILVPGGTHRSAQHDQELHGVALRWLERQLGRAQSPPSRPGPP